MLAAFKPCAVCNVRLHGLRRNTLVVDTYILIEHYKAGGAHHNIAVFVEELNLDIIPVFKILGKDLGRGRKDI